MGKQSTKNKRTMAYKAKPLGYDAKQLIDEVLMANSQVMMIAASVATNDLTKEGIYKAIALILKESAEIQRAANEVRYLGK